MIIMNKIIRTSALIILSGFVFYGCSGNNNSSVSNGSVSSGLSGSIDKKRIITFQVTGKDIPVSLTIQSDGKIVIAGSSVNTAVTESFLALTRLNTDFTIDTTFDGDGLKLINASEQTGLVFTLAKGLTQDSNGDFFALSDVQSTFVAGTNGVDYAIAKIKNANGALDIAFQNNGIKNYSFDLGANNQDFSRAILGIANSAALVAGGLEVGTNDFDVFVSKISSDGTPDSTFGVNGRARAIFNLGGINEFANAIAVQADGKIVVAGYADNATDSDFIIVRFNADGSLDTSFDSDGKLVYSFNLGGTNNDIATGLAIQTDGKILVSGYADIAANNKDVAIIRLNSDGTLDPTFGGAGRKVFALDLGTVGSAINDMAKAIVIDANSKIVIAGTTSIGTNSSDFFVLRLNNDGGLDPTFSGDGIMTVSFDLGGNNQDDATALSLESNNQYVVAGKVDTSATDTVFGVVRINP